MTDIDISTHDHTRSPFLHPARSGLVSVLAMKDGEAVLDGRGGAVRPVHPGDGALLWELARDAGGIDLNAPYAYMMTARNFAATCVIAEVYGKPAGFATAHRLPSRPDTLFVWQVAVLPEFRGLGLGRRLLDGLVALRGCAGVRVVEATVTPGNAASEALFTGFAKARGARLDIRAGFTEDDFPDDARHAAERLFVIHPIHSFDQ
ncbi:MAG: diaminobutyrate acetyltransferase [Alphaproteobacteria bacterium]|nr:diaminobutyrate acetyltransferase [Alphaproteobacteria bacterium]